MFAQRIVWSPADDDEPGLGAPLGLGHDAPAQHGHFPILLKTVVMQHNLQHICRIADFAAEHRLEVLYQPIEQNYNTKEDARWFEHSDNWPTDPTLAVETVTKLIDLKRKGRPIMNTVEQLQVMIDYFQAPADLRVAVQDHVAHEKRTLCSALTDFQV
jgi:hypothetical protein